MYVVFFATGDNLSSNQCHQLLPAVEELPIEDREWIMDPRLSDVTDGHSNPPALAREFGSR